MVILVGGEMASMRPLYKAINCVMKVEAILDRKFLKPPFRETIKPPGPGKKCLILEFSKLNDLLP